MASVREISSMSPLRGDKVEKAGCAAVVLPDTPGGRDWDSSGGYILTPEDDRYLAAVTGRNLNVRSRESFGEALSFDNGETSETKSQGNCKCSKGR